MAAQPDLLGLDTSVVLRLLTGQPESQARLALEVLHAEMALGRRCLVCDLVVVEAYFALHSHYQVPKKEALAVLLRFLDSPEIEASEEITMVIKESLTGSSKPGLVDRLIAQQYRMKGGALLTFEKASVKLPQTRILNA